jgi:hypothetical protein
MTNSSPITFLKGLRDLGYITDEPGTHLEDEQVARAWVFFVFATAEDPTVEPWVLILTFLRERGEDLESAMEAARKIRRTGGRPPDAENTVLAAHIAILRESGDKWAVVEYKANEWLKKRNRSEISLARLRQIYKEHEGDTVLRYARVVDALVIKHGLESDRKETLGDYLI